MPLKISDLGKTRKSVTFKYELSDGREEDIAVVYNPLWFTVTKEAELREITGPMRGAEWEARHLEALLVSWDVLDDKGKPYPTNFDALKDLPVNFLQAVRTAVARDIRPDPTTAGTSGGTS